MAPLLGRLGNGGGTIAGFGFGRRKSPVATGESILSFPTGAVYAFSGQSTLDLTGNGNTVTYSSFSTTQKKWSSYSSSFFVDGTSDSSWNSKVQTPTFTPSSSGWSIEFWVYPTSWAGKYLLHGGNDSFSINVQSNEFRFYRAFTSSSQIVSETTSNYLNQWNFFQIFYDGSSTRFRINGTQKASISGNSGVPSQVAFGNKLENDSIPITGYFQDIVVYNAVSRSAQSSPTTPFGL